MVLEKKTKMSKSEFPSYTVEHCTCIHDQLRVPEIEYECTYHNDNVCTCNFRIMHAHAIRV